MRSIDACSFAFPLFFVFFVAKISWLNPKRKEKCDESKFWNTKLLAGIALVAGLAVVATRSGRRKKPMC